MRFTEARRIGADGPIVATWVDDALRRRTLVVRFSDSDDANVQRLIEHVESHVPMRPPTLDDGKGP